jgi:hypothetical protein
MLKGIKNTFKKILNPFESLIEGSKKDAKQAAHDLTIGAAEDTLNKILGHEKKDPQQEALEKMQKGGGNYTDLTDEKNMSKIRNSYQNQDAQKMANLREYLSRVKGEESHAIGIMKQKEDMRNQQAQYEVMQKLQMGQEKNSSPLPMTSKAARGKINNKKTITQQSSFETKQSKGK